MNNINADERGRTAFSKGKSRQPMNDTQFVAIVYGEVQDSDETPKTVKAYYISQWKTGYDEAKNKAETKAASKKKGKKKAKKKAKKK